MGEGKTTQFIDEFNTEVPAEYTELNSIADNGTATAPTPPQMEDGLLHRAVVKSDEATLMEKESLARSGKL